MNLNELIDRRDDILEIAVRSGVEDVRVFGSAAKGEAGEHSDIDVLIRLVPGRTLLDIVAFKQDLEELLGCEVHVVTEKSISPYIKEAVFREAVRL